MKFFKYLILPVLLASIIAIPSVVFGQPDLGSGFLNNARETAGFTEANEFTLSQRIGSIIQAGLSFVGIIFMILTIYAGLLWMNARGDQSQVDKALDILRAAAIGLVIVVSAYSITTFVVTRFLS